MKYHDGKIDGVFLEYVFSVGNKRVLCLGINDDSGIYLFVPGFISDVGEHSLHKAKFSITPEPMETPKDRYDAARALRQDLGGLDWKYIDFYPPKETKESQ